MGTMTYYVALGFKKAEDDGGDIVACDPKEVRQSAEIARKPEFHPKTAFKHLIPNLASDRAQQPLSPAEAPNVYLLKETKDASRLCDPPRLALQPRSTDV
jgi:hypothetical protein